MGFNFPSSPTSGQTYTPAGGPTFAWNGVTWMSQTQGVPVTVSVGDTPPPNPALGQLYWESDTGNMFIWYADADSAQWVQVSGNVAQNAPMDGGEYVLCNGVWRKIRESFDLAGLTTKDVTVPTWNPTQARITMQLYTTVSNTTAFRISIDGTTFPSGATDYAIGGYYHTSSGAGGFGNNTVTNYSYWYASSFTAGSVPFLSESHFTLVRAPSNYFSFNTHGSDWTGASWNDSYFSGNTAAAPFPGTGPIKAIRWFLVNVTALTSGKLTVEWLQ